MPEPIIGYKLVQYVERNDGKTTNISPGDTIMYQFVDTTTIQGEGLHTLPTVRWLFTRSGNTATVVLEYEIGFSEDTLTFASATEGAYESIAQSNDRTTGGRSRFLRD